ncbi:hypothetical protein [Trueperella pyogenes]|nr:hypothetical protein [Trueperella pyogenes]
MIRTSLVADVLKDAWLANRDFDVVRLEEFLQEYFGKSATAGSAHSARI